MPIWYGMSWYESVRLTKREMVAGLQEEYVSAEKVMNNTLEWKRPDGTLVVRHHSSDILEIGPDGSIIITLDGYSTVTTKQRVNRYLPYGCSIFIEHGDLFYHKSGLRCVFVEGMKVDRTGVIVGIDLGELIPYLINRRLKIPRVNLEILSDELQVELDRMLEEDYA